MRSLLTAPGSPGTPTTRRTSPATCAGVGSTWPTTSAPARFTDPHTVRADDGRSWHGDRIVIAVGCRAAPLPVPGDEMALSYRDILTLKALPHEVAVIGGADTGCQMASIFADFGAGVRLIEAGPRIVSGADSSISAALSQAFEAKGMQVITGAR